MIGDRWVRLAPCHCGCGALTATETVVVSGVLGIPYEMHMQNRLWL